MTSFILRVVLAIAVLMSIGSAGMCSIAEASQVGGVPSLADRVSALEAASSTLQGQVSTLQGQVSTLQSQVTTLQNSNSNLQSALDAEITNRQNGDSSLQTAITQEASTRKTQDDALKAEIDSSSTKGFFSVKGLSDLVLGAAATVGTLAVPAGTYLVTADAILQNLKSSQNWDCTLRLASDPNTIIADTAVDTDSSTGAVGGSNNAVIVAMVTLAAADTIDMICESTNGDSGSQILAAKIAAVTISSATITNTP